MTAPLRIAIFAVALAAAFGGALGVGSLVGPTRSLAPSAHGAADAHALVTGGPPAGLSVEQDGFRLATARSTLTAGRAQPFSFAVIGPDGAPVRDFDLEHERRLHLIVVRRDLGVFRHLHPRLGANGRWTIPLTLPAGGVYRAFADFTVAGERRTLGVDLFAGGAQTLTAPTRDPYRALLERHGDELTFTVERAGKPVEVGRYLGARGHLVVLREGDLAYLHAHPVGDDPRRIVFETPFPSDGRYRLFLQYRAAGAIHTAEFTQDVTS